MPTEWDYHADGVGTAVTTTHSLDGSLKSIRAKLDTFRVRGWTEDVEDIEAAGHDPEKMHYDEETDAFEEYGDGAHATLRFTMEGSSAVLSSIEPEDGDRVEPRHLALLPAAERIVGRLDGVQSVADPLDTIAEPYFEADRRGVHIDALDA